MLGGAAGAFIGYLIFQALIHLAPVLRAGLSPLTFFGPPTNLLDGLLTGLGMSLGIVFFSNSPKEAPHA